MTSEPKRPRTAARKRARQAAGAAHPRRQGRLVAIGAREVKLTNLDKPFWPALGIAKRDLLQYYADVSPVLLPHLADRAMVMKRYPDGADGEPFFMKRAPSPRPEWIETCAITHGSGNVIDFPIVQDLASLLWVVNLGCIDLNPWYARCDDVDRPDYLHFDLDPVPEATYAGVVETAQLVRAGAAGPRHGADRQDDRLARPARLRARSFAGRRRRRSGASPSASRSTSPPCGPTSSPPNTGSPSARPAASSSTTTRTPGAAPSPRPTRRGRDRSRTVSAPITWDELDAGARIEDFDLCNMPARVAAVGDLWAPLLAASGASTSRRCVPSTR